MKTMVASLIAFTMLLSSSTIASAQVSPQEFAIDGSKPYVYIKFDHAGPRERVDPSEPTQGLWLRIVNNSVVPIEVETMDTATNANLILLPDVIKGIERSIPRSGSPREVMPMGYGTGMGVFRTIPSGKSLVFSVPANHVSPYWYMQVPFNFKLPPVKAGNQPICYAMFMWEDLPNSYSNATKH